MAEKNVIDNIVISSIDWIERFTLITIVIMTVAAIYFELNAVFERGSIQLADLLLLFIYSEILLMVGVFYSSREIPLAYPIFIAITALARLIILQGKEMDPQNILYEAIAIAVLAIAVWILGSAKRTRLSTISEEDSMSVPTTIKKPLD